MTRRRLGRLPAGPLLAAVGRHPAIRAGERGWKARLRAYAGPGAVETCRQAARDGWLRLVAVERLCDRFGWHPRELYGDAYDAAIFGPRARQPAGERGRP